jgi:cobalt-zinc-cadmium efflux system protein
MSHAHHDRDSSVRGLTIALVLVCGYAAVEVAGGLLANSLALLADAGHMLSDAAALGFALFAVWIARRPRSPERTFGYYRTEILAALVNGVTLVIVAVYILHEAWGRLASPEAVEGKLMTWIAAGGLLVNLAAMAALQQGRHESLLARGAWLHVLADTLGSVQVIAAGALVSAFGWTWADPVAGVLIAVLVVLSAFRLLGESVNVLLEGSPKHVDATEVQSALERIDGIVDVHDLHIWTITSGFEALSVHARVEGRDRALVLREARELVRERFGIGHSTVQLEGADDCRDGGCG